MRSRCCAMVTAGLALVGPVAKAQTGDPSVTAPSALPTPPGPAVAAPAYSIPWQLRPAAVGNVVRSDTSVAFFNTKNAMTGAEQSGATIASMLLATYKITPSLAPLLRVAVVQNSEPGPALGSGTAFVNPIIGLLYGRKLSGPFRGSAFLGTSIPVGMGGGNAPNSDDTAAARSRGIAARSAMDNAMFAVNYMTPLAGLDVAYVAHGLTVQAEATVLQLLRVRNKEIDKVSNRTNFTAGLHAGYFIIPLLSLGGEVRWQQWLKNETLKTSDPARNTVTFAAGPRLHFKVGDNTWIRPGLSYARAFDAPLKDSDYNIVQVDVPVAF